MNFKLIAIAAISIWLILMGSILLAVGTEFFGIRIMDEAKIDEALTKVIRTENGEVSFKYTKGLVDTSIYCWGTIYIRTIRLKIHNESNFPIRMNYITDSYNLRTKEGKIFLLKMTTKITNYPEVINPDEYQLVFAQMPFNIEEDQVELIAIELDYGDVVIGLRKIEELKT